MDEMSILKKIVLWLKKKKFYRDSRAISPEVFKEIEKVLILYEKKIIDFQSLHPKKGRRIFRILTKEMGDIQIHEWDLER